MASAIGLPGDHVTPIEREGVIEIPVTVIAERHRRRHLQICAVSLSELKTTAEFALANELPLVNIVSHSFELANRAGTAPNKVHVRRFEGLCGWLADEHHRLPTARFSELGDLPLDIPSATRRPSGLRRFGRLIEQIWSNHVAERN